MDSDDPSSKRPRLSSEHESKRETEKFCLESKGKSEKPLREVTFEQFQASEEARVADIHAKLDPLENQERDLCTRKLAAGWRAKRLKSLEQALEKLDDPSVGSSSLAIEELHLDLDVAFINYGRRSIFKSVAYPVLEDMEQNEQDLIKAKAEADARGESLDPSVAKNYIERQIQKAKELPEENLIQLKKERDDLRRQIKELYAEKRKRKVKIYWRHSDGTVEECDDEDV